MLPLPEDAAKFWRGGNAEFFRIFPFRLLERKKNPKYFENLIELKGGKLLRVVEFGDSQYSLITSQLFALKKILIELLSAPFIEP